MPDVHDIAARLKNLRSRAGMTMGGLASEIGMKGASSYQRYESSKNYSRREYLPLELAIRIGRVLEGKGKPPIQNSEVLDLAGVDRAHGVGSDQPRTPYQIIEHHASAVKTGDLDAVMMDFGEHSTVLTMGRSYKGFEEIQSFYSEFLKDVSGADWTSNRVFEGGALLVHWKAETPDERNIEGVDTFVFLNGVIHTQTIFTFPT